MDRVARLRIAIYALGGALLGAGVAVAVFMPELVADAAKNPQYTSPVMLFPFFAGGGAVVGAIGGALVGLVVGASDRILRRRWWWADVLVRVAAVSIVVLCTYPLVATSSDAATSGSIYLTVTIAIAVGGIVLLDRVFIRPNPRRDRGERHY